MIATSVKVQFVPIELMQKQEKKDDSEDENSGETPKKPAPSSEDKIIVSEMACKITAGCQFAVTEVTRANSAWREEDVLMHITREHAEIRVIGTKMLPATYRRDPTICANCGLTGILVYRVVGDTRVIDVSCIANGCRPPPHV